MTGHRAFKNSLYGQFARIGKALSSARRLEILELLAQGERTVDSLATEMGLSLANTSQHLQALRHAALVEGKKACSSRIACRTRRSSTCVRRSEPSLNVNSRTWIVWSGSISAIARTPRPWR